MASVNQCYFPFDNNGLDTGGCGKSIICGPDGRVTSLSIRKELKKFIPLGTKLQNVKRSRELGILRLDSRLKKFSEHIKIAICNLSN
jgi:hypothetical protein